MPQETKKTQYTVSHATIHDEDQQAWYTHIYGNPNKPPLFTAWGGTKELSVISAQTLVGLMQSIQSLKK